MVINCGPIHFRNIFLITVSGCKNVWKPPNRLQDYEQVVNLFTTVMYGLIPKLGNGT